MKLLPLLFLSFFFTQSVFASAPAIYTIEEFDHIPAEVDVSPEALPADVYAELISQTSALGFTPVNQKTIDTLFEILKTDRNARNKRALGNCSTRRKYIQDYLKKMTVVSGKLYVSCPSFNGTMRLRDHSNNHTYSFANFHDTNIPAVKTAAGMSYQVMDVQFEDAPVTLGDYLAEIEASQRIMPLKRKGTTRGLCYWTVSTPVAEF